MDVMGDGDVTMPGMKRQNRKLLTQICAAAGGVVGEAIWGKSGAAIGTTAGKVLGNNGPKVAKASVKVGKTLKQEIKKLK